jgi:transcriptional regulator with XRE-family HTH domain
VPRGRPPKSVDPNASCAHLLGFELRCARTRKGLTLEALADQIGFTPQHISQVELAETYPSEEFLAVVDRVLDADGRLLELYPAVQVERARARERRAIARREALRSSKEVEDVRRRAFLGFGLSVVLLGPEAAARASADDWDRIARAWSYEINTASDMRVLLPGLAADLKRLQANGGPQRVVAQLASYVATIAVSSGDAPAARRWWHRGRASALATGDGPLIAYVTGRQAIEGLYGANSPAQVITIADEALSATTAPCTGRMEAIAAKAQALAALGRHRDASEALTSLERTFNRLPRDVTTEKLSLLGWPEQKLHHVRSYCSMYGTTPAAGEIARTEALRLYADAMWRGPVQIKLHQAASEADAPDAVAILSNLSDAQRSNKFVRMIAGRALAVCESRGADVTELRQVLA